MRSQNSSVEALQDALAQAQMENLCLMKMVVDHCRGRAIPARIIPEKLQPFAEKLNNRLAMAA